MGFIGYPKVKLLTRSPYYYREHVNTFSILAAQAEKILCQRPAIEDVISGADTREANFFHFDNLIGTNGAVMLPPIYEEENTMLTMMYKATSGQQIRELQGTEYSTEDVFNGSIPSDIDDIVGVYEGERYEPYTGIMDGIDYSLSSQQWEEVWAERVKKRPRIVTSEEEEGENINEEEEEPEYYIDNYVVKVHQDMIKENSVAQDPVISPPTGTQPDLHFCLKRQKQYPPMPAGLNEAGDIEGLQMFWAQISKGPATPSQQAVDTSRTYPEDADPTDAGWDSFDPVTEEPFISVGFGSGSNNRRVEIVFPVSKAPYAVIWYQQEGLKRRTYNIKYILQNANPVMASDFNLFVYVMLGEISIRVTNADMSTVLWEDKIVDEGQEDSSKRYIKILGAAPYIRGKNMQCTVGLSRIKFELSAVGYTPVIQSALQADNTEVIYKLHGAYQGQYHFVPTDEGTVGDYKDVEDWEPTEETATGDKRTTFSYVPFTSIYSFMRYRTKGKFKEYYWVVILKRNPALQYITPLLFSIEANAPPVPTDEPPEWCDITNLLIQADISQSAPDWFSIDQYLTLQLRDDNFIESYDGDDPIYQNSYDYFSSEAREIKLYTGWHTDNPDSDQPSSISDLPDLTELFTGFVTNVSLDYISELNVVNLKVSHQIERMKNIPILQSPFYDGMWTSGVYRDLVKRGQLYKDESPKEPNVIFIEDNVEVENFVTTGYRLGIGADYQSPIAKFDGSEVIMDCIRDIAKRDATRIYGHPNGALVLQKSSKGMVDEAVPVATFYSYPSYGTPPSHSDYYTMFNGLTFEQTPHDTVNFILYFTMDRDLVTPLVERFTKLKDGELDVTLTGYKKILRYKNTALGDQASLRMAIRRYADVVFYPPKKASFEGLGHPELLPIQVVRVITSKGNLGNFRIVSISSTIAKDGNEFKYEASYELEWQNQ